MEKQVGQRTYVRVIERKLNKYTVLIHESHDLHCTRFESDVPHSPVYKTHLFVLKIGTKTWGTSHTWVRDCYCFNVIPYQKIKAKVGLHPFLGCDMGEYGTVHFGSA